MEIPFADEATKNIFDGESTKNSRKALPEPLHATAQLKLIRVAAAMSVEDLRIPAGNHLEALKGDRAGQHSIRINDKYRICFTMTEAGAVNIEVTDYH